jgi:hypothetical protein
MTLPSTAGFGRKLLLFLMVDAVTASMQGIWENQSLAGIVGLFAFRSLYSVILAALWNAIDKH